MSNRPDLSNAQNAYMRNREDETLELSTEENKVWLSLKHIQTLQLASAISGNEITYNSGVNGFVPVEVNVLPDSNEISVIFLEDKFDCQRFALKDYTYILSMFSLC